MRDLKSYAALSFDCYGTLVDWEAGIIESLKPLTCHFERSSAALPTGKDILSRYSFHESRIQEQFPTLRYSSILEQVYIELAGEWGLAQHVRDVDRVAFGASIGTWPTFPDTVAALNELRKHFKLVILSNVDKESFNKTLAGPLADVEFDAVYVAEEIGSYKPDINNFRYLTQHCLDDLNVTAEKILHTAYALFHDLVPAKKIGLDICWIERKPNVMGGELENLDADVAIDVRFPTLKAMADAVNA